MDTIRYAEDIVKTNLDKVLSNPYIMAILKVTLTLYAVSLAPKPPVFIANLFANTFVKIIAIFLIAYLANIDFQLSILLAIIFVLSVNLMSNRGVFESFETQSSFFSDKTKYTTLLGVPAEINKMQLIESNSDNYSGCENITLNDLVAIFNGDYLKLQNTVEHSIYELMKQLPENSPAKDKLEQISQSIGLPHNVTITDSNARLIATLLINYGYQISNTCQPPYQLNMINQ